MLTHAPCRHQVLFFCKGFCVSSTALHTSLCRFVRTLQYLVPKYFHYIAIQICVVLFICTTTIIVRLQRALYWSLPPADSSQMYFSRKLHFTVNCNHVPLQLNSYDHQTLGTASMSSLQKSTFRSPVPHHGPQTFRDLVHSPLRLLLASEAVLESRDVNIKAVVHPK